MGKNVIKFRLASEKKPLIILEVNVNGQGPFDFALDTGATMTVLCHKTAQKLGITASTPAKGTGAGGQLAVSLTRLGSLAIGELEVKDLQVAVMDLTGVSQAAGTEIAGVIGYNLLEKFRVTIDYPKRKILFTN